MVSEQKRQGGFDKLIEVIDHTFWFILTMSVIAVPMIGGIILTMIVDRMDLMFVGFAVGIILFVIVFGGIVIPLVNDYDEAVKTEIENADCENLEELFNYYNSTRIEEQLQEKYKAECLGIPEEPWWE